MNRVVLFAQTVSQATRETHLYPIKYFGLQLMYFWYIKFVVQTLFFIIVISMGRYSLQYVVYLFFLFFSGLPHVLYCLFDRNKMFDPLHTFTTKITMLMEKFSMSNQ